MELRLLSNEELIRKAHTEINHITSTPLEIELIRRLEELTEWQPVLDVMQQHYDSVKDCADFDDVLTNLDTLSNIAAMPELLAVFEEHNVDDIKVLREKLERADKFYDLAQEAGEAFTMLAKLAETSQ